MGTDRALEDTFSPHFLSENVTQWQQLFQAKEYQQLAQLIQKNTPYILNNDPILGNILAAVSELCLSCHQIQATVEFHERVHQEATICQQSLHQVTATILHLLVRFSTAVPDQTPESTNTEGESDPPKKLKLWQQVRNLLGLLTELSPSPSLSPQSAPEAPIFHSQSSLPYETEMPFLAIYCLGLFRVYVNEYYIERWPGNKSKSIFKYMIIHRDQPVPQDILMDLFWRGADPDAARRNLYQAIYQLRQALQINNDSWSYIFSENGCYGLNNELHIWLDSEQFQLHYETGKRLEKQGRFSKAVQEYVAADGLYEGDFMVEDVYEEWPVFQREHLKLNYLDCLNRLSDHYYAGAQFNRAIMYGRKLLAKDNCREDAHRRLMLAYYQQGQRHLALRQYHYCAEALKQELDVAPTPVTVELYKQIQKNRVQFSEPSKMNAN